MKTKKNGVSNLNFSLMDVDELVRAVFGELVFKFSLKVSFSSVSIDSRDVKSNSLFIPLRGEKQDGHSYIGDALKNGADFVVVDFEFLNNSANKKNIEILCQKYSASCVVVKNNLYALQNLAASYLNKFPDLYKIGITGSAGKTTTKEILGSIYSQKYNTIMNKGNLNSETGLPLSVFNVRPFHQVGIFELGMNRKGEISELANVLFPNAAIITNIGSAHIGILGSKQVIAEEKKQIFLNFDNSCVGFIPDCEFSNFLQTGVKGRIIKSSKNENIKKIENIGFCGSKIFYKDVEINFPLVGDHNLQNAICCINFAEKKNFSAMDIKAGLEAVLPLFGRSQVKHSFVTYLLDCYNANPESMNEALDFCDSVKTKTKKHFIIGSMLELGNKSDCEHKKIVKRVIRSSADFVYFFGDEFVFGKEVFENKEFFYFKTNQFDELKNTLNKNIKKGDFVLLKGSRGLELEKLEPVLDVKEATKNE